MPKTKPQSFQIKWSLPVEISVLAAVHCVFPSISECSTVAEAMGCCRRNQDEFIFEGVFRVQHVHDFIFGHVPIV